nr:hypothetical protein OG546_46065 [Streptomyces antimycoticus]
MQDPVLHQAVVADLVLGGLMRRRLWRTQRPPQGQTPVPVEVPVTGRRQALNGPGTKVPSHTHSHARTYAIDLTHHPSAAATPPFRPLWPLGRRPRHYPAFGSPVLAPGDGVVVATTDRRRDHLSRTSLPGIAYLCLDGSRRSLGGPAIIGATTPCSSWTRACTRASGTSGADLSV